MRRPVWIRPVTPGSNPTQTDRMQQVLPFGQGTDPFLMLAEDWFSRTGFDWHPHRGFETVTYVVEGVLEHRDNAGGSGILDAGDLQWTTTGKGVLHTEIAHERKGVHTLQLWLNLPAAKKMVEPRYQDLRAKNAPVARADGAVVRVFAGRLLGQEGPALLYTPATVADLHLDADATVDLDVAADQVVLLYVLSGSVDLADAGGPDAAAGGFDAGKVAAGHSAFFEPGGPIRLHATKDTHAIVYGGRPIGEPVAQHGPFVMNTRDEIVQAVRDFQSGAFGTSR